jgi:DNA-binding transcriptional regulator YhcF (GntR family)
MEFFVDRQLPVPLRTQLQGLIEYGIACGELVPGELLPSVRELAEKVGVAPMTVSQVYADLKTAGLIETRPGAGTYVTHSLQARLASRPETALLHRRIDQLIDDSQALGIRSAELVSLISSRVFYRDSIGRRMHIVMVGVFPDATASYAKFIAGRLGNSVTVEPLTVSDIERSPQARARANSADLVITLVNRYREVSALVPNTKVVAISFIPSEETRMALAALDPLSRVAIISRFPDFLPIMMAGVQRFASHVQETAGATLDTPEVAKIVAQANVVVYATGAEAIVGRLSSGVQAIEYRHTPNTADIDRIILPIIRSAGELPMGAPAVPAEEEREAT